MGKITGIWIWNTSHSLVGYYMNFTGMHFKSVSNLPMILK